MDILYLLVPLSAVLVLGIVAVFGWAVQSGQFDDLEQEGQRVLTHDPEPFDPDQGGDHVAPQQSLEKPSTVADAPGRHLKGGQPGGP